MGVYLQLDLVDDGVGQAELARPDLMPPSLGVLLGDSWSRRPAPGAENRLRRGGQRLRDGKRIFERIEDQRTGRKGFSIDTMGSIYYNAGPSGFYSQLPKFTHKGPRVRVPRSEERQTRDKHSDRQNRQRMPYFSVTLEI